MIPRKNAGKIRILGLGGSGGHSYCNFEKRLPWKLHWIILPHFGPVTFSIHFGETRKPIIFMVCPILGFPDFRRRQITLQNSRKSRILFERYYCWKSRNVGNQNVERIGKVGSGKSWRILNLWKFENLKLWESIFSLKGRRHPSWFGQEVMRRFEHFRPDHI